MHSSTRAPSGFFVAACAMLIGCGDVEPAMTAPPALVSVMTVIPMPMQLNEELPGRVVALRVSEIRPQVSGIVQRRLFEQGTEVRLGQPLFEIEAAPFRADRDMAAASLLRAEAAESRARIQTERLRPLVDADAISRQAYDDAVSSRDQAAAEVALARATLERRTLDLEFASVTAPISGRIDQALVTEGALVGSGDSTPMARIQQIDQVYVDVRQPSSSLESLRQAIAANSASGNDGIPVTVLRGDGSAYDLRGRILFSGINVDSGTGDVLLRALVDNSERLLLPGMFVRARVPRASYTDALSVPQQAVVRSGSKASVWILDAENRAHAVTIELGELINRRYRITAGISAGQKIVIEGIERLTEDALVAPQEWRGPETPADITIR